MEELEFNKPLQAQTTPIPGLLVFDIPVHGDSRGWFKENWQKEKMAALGLPDFGPVQNNISFNAEKGVTRGIHAEPWDKYISIGAGRVFGAWVDLREGDSFGTVFTIEIDPTKAVFVPRGVGNSFQALENNTVYTYLVNDHWSAEAQEQYTFLNLSDATANIAWPLSLDEAELSAKDMALPQLSHVTPMPGKKILITGANGQLGRALRAVFPTADFTTRAELDITSDAIETARPWRQYSTIINAAAYTAVDSAETSDGKQASWEINAKAVARLAAIAAKHNITFIHYSSDYVFDGRQSIHNDDEPLSPLGVYGQTKAAGEIAAATVHRHYILRTSWVIGEGDNFVRTMKNLAERGIKPSVVSDQVGRLTFTSDLALATKHLLTNDSPFGTYNMSSSGEPASWADVAAAIYELCGANPSDVSGVSTDDYFKDKPGTAPRPLQSTLNIAKITSTGYRPQPWRIALKEYIDQSST